MEHVIVLDRVTERHPDVSKKDAADVWNNCIRCMPAYEGDPDRYLAIGTDNKGRLIELVVVRQEGGLWLVIHGQTPPQENIKRALGFRRRKS